MMNKLNQSLLIPHKELSRNNNLSHMKYTDDKITSQSNMNLMNWQNSMNKSMNRFQV